MLLTSYIVLILKQLIRMKMALFFTLIFPVILYLFFGYSSSAVTLIAFIHFSMQSAMLQTLGIFASVQKNTSWGQYAANVTCARYLFPIGHHHGNVLHRICWGPRDRII